MSALHQRETTQAAPAGGKALELHGISKSFGEKDTRVEVLHDISFAANYGEFVGIVGPSGSGKSTFLQILGGLQTPTTGKISVDGKAFESLSLRAREQLRLESIGFVLQAYSLVPYLSVSEQFELVRKVKATPNMPAEQFSQVLERLGITELLHKYPETLSGGQRQRVAIARALYADPQIVLADEPTAALDTERAFEVMEIFRDLAHSTGKAIVVVTHDTRLERYVDALYEITDGVLASEALEV